MNTAEMHNYVDIKIYSTCVCELSMQLVYYKFQK